MFLRERLRAFFAPFAPGIFPYFRFLLALAIGLIGALIFVHYRLPLPWMLGAMATCTIAALLQMPVATPRVVRPPMTAIIGVMLGAGLTSHMFAGVPGWLPTLAGMILFVAACGLLCAVYFRKAAGMEMTTAYFAGMPGGLIEMITLGEHRGGDVRTIALCQSARIVLIVFTLPFLIRYLGHIDGTMSRPTAGQSIFDAGWLEHLWLIATAAAGFVLGKFLRLPAHQILGPFAMSGVIHILGLNTFQPSVEIVNFAQLILGAFLGCSFAKSKPSQVLWVLAISAGSTVILLGLTMLFAFAVSHVSTYGFVPLLLAYSPGGLAEMSLMALVLQIETAFVVCHHVVRILLVVVGADLVFRRLLREPGKGGT